MQMDVYGHFSMFMSDVSQIISNIVTVISLSRALQIFFLHLNFVYKMPTNVKTKDSYHTFPQSKVTSVIRA